MTRVSVRRGRNNIIFVAPHAPDDQFTGDMTKHIAELTDSYMVINNGFKRARVPDSTQDLGDCNRIDHLVNEPVLNAEFLSPLLRYKKIITNQDEPCFIFYIHGFNKNIIEKHGSNIDLIIGYGRGSTNSFTCEKWRKDILQANLEKRDDWAEEATIHVPGFGSFKNDLDRKWEIYIAQKGSMFAARNLNNLCQYFAPLSKNYSPSVHALQLEFAPHLRKNQKVAIEAINFFGQSFSTAFIEMRKNQPARKVHIQEKFLKF